MSTTTLHKTPSRWDCLATSPLDSNSSHQNQRPHQRPMRIQEPEKWVNDKPKYTRKPNMMDQEQFPTMGSVLPPPASVKDYSLLENPEDADSNPHPAVVPSDDSMINLREYLKGRKESTPDGEEEWDPYLSYNMFQTIEDMKARWYFHDLLNNTFVDYDCCIPDETGIDTWETASESDGSGSEDDYESM